jgi:hypothetical protein
VTEADSAATQHTLDATIAIAPPIARALPLVPTYARRCCIAPQFLIPHFPHWQRTTILSLSVA